MTGIDLVNAQTARVGHQPKLPARAVRPAADGTRLEAVGPAGPAGAGGGGDGLWVSAGSLQTRVVSGRMELSESRTWNLNRHKFVQGPTYTGDVLKCCCNTFPLFRGFPPHSRRSRSVFGACFRRPARCPRCCCPDPSQRALTRLSVILS